MILDTQLTTSTNLTLELPSRESSFAFRNEDFYQYWWKFLAPKFSIIHRKENLLLNQKKFLKGLFEFNEIVFAGWNSPGADDLSSHRVRMLKEYTQEVSWDYCKFVVEDEWIQSQAHHDLRLLGYPVKIFPSEREYIADLTQGWETYFKNCSSKQRSSIRQKFKRAKDKKPTLFEYQGQDRVEQFFEVFFKHHIPYWNEKVGFSYFNDPCEREFIIEWCRHLDRLGQLRLQGLMLDEDICNLSVSYIFGEQLFWPLTINTGQHRENFPGILSLQMRIEEAAKQGISFFNMGTGEYPYKVRAANKTIQLHEIFIFNPNSIRAKAYSYWLEKREKNNRSDR